MNKTSSLVPANGKLSSSLVNVRYREPFATRLANVGNPPDSAVTPALPRRSHSGQNRKAVEQFPEDCCSHRKQPFENLAARHATIFHPIMIGYRTYRAGGRDNDRYRNQRCRHLITSRKPTRPSPSCVQQLLRPQLCDVSSMLVRLSVRSRCTDRPPRGSLLGIINSKWPS